MNILNKVFFIKKKNFILSFYKKISLNFLIIFKTFSAIKIDNGS